MAGLHFPITADNGNFMRALHEVTASVREASRQIEADGGSIDRVISKIKSGLATLGIGLGFKELSGQIFQTRAQFEQLEIAFTTMLGSAEKADALLSQLKQTAAITPFEMEDVVGGAKSLLAYGIEAEKVNDTLVRLGDIASGLGIPLNDLTYLYGTTMVQGRMFTQDLRQFQGRGVPIADELAKILGIAKGKVGEAVTAGKVGAKELEQAIIGLTSEGGKFGGLMAKQSDSLKGKWENIKDTIGLMFNEMGQQTSGVMNLTLDATASIVDHWQEVITVLGGVAAAYGAQKGILMLDTAFTAAKNDYGYNAEISQLQSLIPVKEEAAKTDLEQAVASGRLTEAKAAQIAALREEAEEYVKTLALKEAEAQQAEIAAQANLTNALQEKAQADEFVQECEDKIDALFDLGDTIGMEAEQENLNAAMTMQSEAADAVAAATKEAKAASSAHVTAQQNLESASTQINTAQSAGNTAATGVLTIAKEKLAVAIGKVNAMIEANKFAILTGAVVALGYAIYKAATYQSDFEKVTKSAEKASASQEQSMRKEQSALDNLKKSLESAKKGSAEWKSAKEQIVSQFGKYHNGLDVEIEKTGTLASTYDRLTKSIRLSAAARAMEQYRSENDISGDIDSYLESIRKDLTSGVLRKGADGKLKKTAITGDLLNSIMQKAYEYAQKGDSSIFSDKEWEIINQTGAFFSYVNSTGASSYNPTGANRKSQSGAERIRALVELNKKGEEIIAKRYGTTIDEIDGRTPEVDVETSKNLQEAYSEAAKAYDDAKNEVEKMKKNRSAYTEKQWEEAQETLKTAKATYEKAGGTTKESKGMTAAQLEAKEENAAGKLADILRKQAEERLRIEQDCEYERWQSRIDLMQEGEAKVLAQQNLDFDKEKTNLQRRLADDLEAELNRQMAVFDAEQNILASANKKYAKKTFRDSDIDQSAMDAVKARYAALQEDLTKSQQKAEADRLQSAKESFNAYLQEFGNYQQKRKAIEEEYAKRIDEAANSGERKIAIAQRNQAFADLDFEEWQNNGGMALAFGDISKLSRETVQELITDMEKYRSKVIATFDPDKIEKFENALSGLRSAETDFDFIFAGQSDVIDTLKERISLQKQIADNEANEAMLLEQKRQIEEQLRSLNEQIMASTISTGAIGPDGKIVGNDTAINAEMIAQADELRANLDAVNNSLLTSVGNGRQLQSQLKAISKVKYADIQGLAGNLSKLGRNASSLASIFSDDLADSISEGTDALETMFDAFEELSSNIEALAKAGKDAVKATVDASTDIVEGASAGMQASAAATATSLSTMEKASAILAIIGAAIQVATLVASLFDSDKKHERNIERLQDRIDALQKSYDRLGKAAEKAYSTDASHMIEQQNTLLRQQQSLIRQQMAEEKAKKKTDDDKLKEYKDQLDEINELLKENEAKAKEAIIGEDLKSAINDFASAYAEAWEENTDGARKSMQTVKSIVSSALSEMVKKNIQPFAESFYDYLADAMSDGTLTDFELDRLDQLKNEIDIAASRYEGMAKEINDRYDDDNRSQSGAETSFSGMTQETGNSIDGRLTAVYMKQSEMHTLDAERNSLAVHILASMREFTSMASCLNDSNSALRDIRDMMFISTNHLEDIARQSKNLALINTGIENLHHLINTKL